MMVKWMIFGEIVVQIGCPWFPKHVVLALADSIFYPIEPHIYFFCHFLRMVLFAIPFVVDLFVWMGADCCEWTNSSKVDLICSPDLELWNNVPTSAFSKDNITFFVVLDSVNIAPLDSLALLKFWHPNKNGLLRDFWRITLIGMIHLCVFSMSCCWHGISIQYMGLCHSNEVNGTLLL